MNGVTIERQQPLDFAAKADAVIIGSGIRTREIAADPLMLGRIRLDPARQLIGAQCSGTLLLARLGLIGDLPACRSEEHTSELQSLMRLSSAVFLLKKTTPTLHPNSS